MTVWISKTMVTLRRGSAVEEQWGRNVENFLEALREIVSLLCDRTGPGTSAEVA